MMLIKCLLCAMVLYLVQGTKPRVKLSHGVLQGVWKKTNKGRIYASFEGIPYARPPVGEHKFEDPQEMKPWTGVWDASRFLSKCLQYEPFVKKIVGSENCLYVNVYTPKPDTDAALPVVVYIHGGAFMYGSGEMGGPRNLLNKDLVFITLNYRLGPLGFISTEDEVVPGNIGLKDQSFALHWIKNNVKRFGGDPESITLTGCSAGGASVHYHYLSPLSKDTFARGIAFSGAAFAPWTFATQPLQKAQKLASLLGCPTSSSQKLIDCLKERPSETLVKAQVKMFDWKVHMFTMFTPTAEAPGVKKPFLTEYPYHAAVAGQMQKLPLIASVTSEEGLYPAAVYQSSPELLPDLEENWDILASNIFEYNDTLPIYMRTDVAAKIKQHYLGGKPVGQETFHGLVEALGDRHFAADVGRLVRIHALKTNQPTYLYRYSYRAENSLSDDMAKNTKDYGVSHADDVRLLINELARTPSDIEMVESLLEMVYSFASTGVPKFRNAPEWVQVTPGAEDVTYLEILSPTKFEIRSSSDFGQTSFWDNLGFRENQNYKKIREDL